MLAAHLDPLAAVLVQPACDREPAACLRHAGLALAAAITCMHSPANHGSLRVLSAAVGYLRRLSRTLHRGRSDRRCFEVCLLPYLILRIIRRLNVAREIHDILQPSSSLVIGAFAVVFALAVCYRDRAALDLAGTVVVLALTVMLSMKLIGFLMLAVRHEAISQILGLLVLENGVFLGAQILVPGMPLLIEIVILFDLLIVVACFGVLVQYLLTHVGTTSSLELRRLVG